MPLNAKILPWLGVYGGGYQTRACNYSTRDENVASSYIHANCTYLWLKGSLTPRSFAKLFFPLLLAILLPRAVYMELTYDLHEEIWRQPCSTPQWLHMVPVIWANRMGGSTE